MNYVWRTWTGLSRSLLLLGWIGLLLAGCGGGSSGNAMQISAQDAADAKTAALTTGVNPVGNTVTLSWSDTFPAGTGYQVQQQVSGNWTTLATVTGMSGTGQPLSWTGTISASTTLRVVALSSGTPVPLQTSSGSTSVQVSPVQGAPTLQVNHSEPLSGVVMASISGSGGYSSVTYFVDHNLLGSSSTAPNYAVPLDTSKLAPGSHLLIARLATGPGTYLELRLTTPWRVTITCRRCITPGLSGTPRPRSPPSLTSARFSMTSPMASSSRSIRARGSPRSMREPTLQWWAVSCRPSTAAPASPLSQQDNVDIYRWDQSSGASTVLTSNHRSNSPMTDGARATWAVGVSQPYSVDAFDLTTQATSVLSTTAFRGPRLSAGLLGWQEQTATSLTIRATDGTTTYLVSNVLGANFVDSSGGYILFTESGKLYAWSAAGGRQLLLEVQPVQVLASGKTVYFTTPSAADTQAGGALYSVSLP